MNTETINKSDIFKTEIDYVKNPKFKNDLVYLINHLPDYFFEIPASSTGKYHPDYALGEGGLIRHTKAAVRICFELIENPLFKEKYTSDEIDLMLISLVLHDGMKSGKIKSKYTNITHPLIICDYIKENKDNLSFTKDELKFITDNISSHMGPWNKDYDGNEVLPIPKNKYERLIHISDYLASKKFIHINFDKNNNIID